MYQSREKTLGLPAAYALVVGVGCPGEVIEVSLLQQSGAISLDPGVLRPDFQVLKGSVPLG